MRGDVPLPFSFKTSRRRRATTRISKDGSCSGGEERKPASLSGLHAFERIRATFDREGPFELADGARRPSLGPPRSVIGRAPAQGR